MNRWQGIRPVNRTISRIDIFKSSVNICETFILNHKLPNSMLYWLATAQFMNITMALMKLLLYSINLLWEEIFANHMILLSIDFFDYCIHNRRYIEDVNLKICASFNCAKVIQIAKFTELNTCNKFLLHMYAYNVQANIQLLFIYRFFKILENYGLY